MNKLRIALFNSTADTIPPTKKAINAPRWLVYYLANGLIERGHDVTLITIPGSKTKAKTLANNLFDWPKNQYSKILAKKGLFTEQNRHLILNDQTALLEVFMKKKFDLIHTHTELSLPLAALCQHTPTLITHHNPYDSHYNELFAYYQKNFPQIHFSALSRSHAKQAPKIKFDFIINNGADLKNFHFNPKPKNYLLFSGRLIPEKGPDIAVNIARKLNLPLKIIGQTLNNYERNKKYWDAKIAPYLNNSTSTQRQFSVSNQRLIRYHGLIPYNQVSQYYQDAKILLFPNRWPEPFGLSMIEAMACGTPVIAFANGAIPEIVKDRITGYIVKNEKEMISAVKKVYSMSEKDYLKLRQNCRERVEKKFTLERMISGYEKAYNKIIRH